MTMRMLQELQGVFNLFTFNSLLYMGFLTSILGFASLSHGQSIQSLDLSGIWQVTWTDGAHGLRNIEDFIKAEPVDPGRYIEVPVPMELHSALMKKGIVEDLNYG